MSKRLYSPGVSPFRMAVDTTMERWASAPVVVFTSSQVAVSVLDAQSNHLVAPLTLEQRPAAPAAPEACTPGAS